jgi:hypothetical protein
MIELDELVARHKDDVPAKPLFTAYGAAIPVYRSRAGLLVTEAVELDPIDLFLLEAVRAGIQSPRELALFFGLEPNIVDFSIGEMLHNSWVASTTPEPGQIRLAVLPKGQDVLTEKRAQIEVVHETEVWVDLLVRTTEVRLPRQQLLRPIDTKRQGLHRLPAVVPPPRQASDLDFQQLERSVAQSGSQLWPGVQMALLLDVLAVTGRGTMYRPVEVLVFQSNETFEVEFQVYDRGTRRDDYERELRRLDLQQLRDVVPTDTAPPAEELAAFEREQERILSLAAAPASVPAESPQPSPPSVEVQSPAPQVPVKVAETSGEPSGDRAGAGDTRDRLRNELAAEKAILEERNDQLCELAKIIETQKILRNHENRLEWKRVLKEDACRYVVMEFPWITSEAIDDEMLRCFEAALGRKVKLWIAWGLDESGPGGHRPIDSTVSSSVARLQKEFGVHSIRMERRGNTHRKVLLWDSRAAIIASFNWGSFRGDARRPVRHEVGVRVATPREIRDLENEYKKIFSVSSLA